MAYTPFKMKGNPLKRNFGIGMRDKNTLPHGASAAKMKKAPTKLKKEDDSAMKMMKKSPTKLKKEDSPTKMGHKSPSKMKKSAMKLKKDDSAMKMKKESAMKLKKAPTKLVEAFINVNYFNAYFNLMNLVTSFREPAVSLTTYVPFPDPLISRSILCLPIGISDLLIVLINFPFIE